MKNIFDKEVTDEVIARINNLSTASTASWGKMNVAQMLAHCCVTYELIYEPHKHPEPNWLMKKVIQLFAKSTVVGPKPFSKSLRTAPAFLVSAEQDFEAQKTRLINYLIKTQTQGEGYFEGKVSHSFGKLTLSQWNTMFYKHIDHHLMQFGN
ncbi:MAG: DUF1569 domain-containing protein [Chitinophagaceae bacterium]|nr:MAG: DUF1569 domain-containing protein [Chitinophagaceae bacterium]